MKKIILIYFLSSITWAAYPQTQTTEALDARYDDGLSLYFYKNTLKMLNQSESEEFDEMIKDIEKMKFLVVDKGTSKFNGADYKKLLSGYQGEQFEEMMTGRFQGRNFDVYIKEVKGSVKGTIILASDSTSLFVLDIVGKVAIDKATELFKAIDGSTDIGGMIKDFISKDDKKKVKRGKGYN